MMSRAICPGQLSSAIDADFISGASILPMRSSQKPREQPISQRNPWNRPYFSGFKKFRDDLINRGQKKIIYFYNYKTG